MTPQRFFQTFE